MIDLAALSLLLQRLRKHKLAHPINTLVPCLDREMMRLSRRGIQDTAALFLRGGGHELEAERRDIVSFFFFGVEFQRLEGGVEFVGGEGRARDGVFVDVDVFEGVNGFGVAVHGEGGAVEAAVVLVPFVAKHFRLALLHPAGVVDVGDCGGFLVVDDWGEVRFFDRGHGEVGLATVGCSGC